MATTIDSIGSGRTYADYNAWQSATDIDLSSVDIYIGELYDSETTYAWRGLTGATNTVYDVAYRWIRAHSSTNYDPDGDTGVVMRVSLNCYNEDFIRVGGAGNGFKIIDGVGGGTKCLSFAATVDDARADSMVLEDDGSASTSAAGMSCLGTNMTIRCCISFSTGSSSTAGGTAFGGVSGSTGELYHCVGWGFTNASWKGQFEFDAATGSLTVENCYGFDGNTNDFEWHANNTHDYNASSDSTADGTNSVTSILGTTGLVDYINGDYNPDPDEGLIGAGVDRSSVAPVDFYGVTWDGFDIGAVNYTAPSGTRRVFSVT